MPYDLALLMMVGSLIPCGLVVLRARREVAVLTDKWRAEQAARERERAHQQQIVCELAGGIAHNFNNLLAVVLGYADLLHARARPESDEARDLAAIMCAGQRAAELIRQMQAFSRQQLLKPCVLDLAQALRDVEPCLRGALGGAELRVAAANPCWVEIDRSQLERILLVLATHANKTMPHGGTFSLALSHVMLEDSFAGAPKSHVKLTLSDSGTGMAANELEHLFDPFHPGPSDDFETTGLQLASVLGTVLQSGGQISVDSVIGTGTTYSLYFPQVESPLSSARVSATADRLESPAGGRSMTAV
jgi:signal transduction histidine kinase